MLAFLILPGYNILPGYCKHQFTATDQDNCTNDVWFVGTIYIQMFLFGEKKNQEMTFLSVFFMQFCLLYPVCCELSCTQSFGIMAIWCGRQPFSPFSLCWLTVFQFLTIFLLKLILPPFCSIHPGFTTHLNL